MSKQVLVRSGVYANKPVVNQVFDLVRPLSSGKKGLFVTVDGNPLGFPNRNIRVAVETERDVEYHGVVMDQAPVETTALATDTVLHDAHIALHKTELKKENIRKRFAILDQMTNATVDGTVRGLIVSGPPGVGKSYGVETITDAYDAECKMAGEKFTKVEVCKGSMTPIGLYQTLYNMSSVGDILVFDDCDTILFDEQCLNMLKAVLDSGKKRTITWKAESAALRREGIPDRFDFKGAVIFISNVNFDTASKRIKPHLEALQSRCHYVDLEMDGIEDRFLRIEQIVEDGMLDEYGFGDAGVKGLIEFMKDNGERLREVSLRMVLKIADLKKMDEDNWQDLARGTCMKRVI